MSSKSSPAGKPEAPTDKATAHKAGTTKAPTTNPAEHVKKPTIKEASPKALPEAIPLEGLAATEPRWCVGGQRSANEPLVFPENPYSNDRFKRWDPFEF